MPIELALIETFLCRYPQYNQVQAANWLDENKVRNFNDLVGATIKHERSDLLHKWKEFRNKLESQ